MNATRKSAEVMKLGGSEYVSSEAFMPRMHVNFESVSLGLVEFYDLRLYYKLHDPEYSMMIMNTARDASWGDYHMYHPMSFAIVAHRQSISPLFVVSNMNVWVTTAYPF